MSDTKYDVVVIGAGPAGSLAALHAAQGGLRVCLVERKPVTGTPVRCGEGIGLKGFSLSMELRPEWILSTIDSIRMVSPDGTAVDIGSIEKSFIVDRSIMDRDLAAMAQQAGAHYITDTTILQVQRQNDGLYCCSNGQFAALASCVICADGVESRLARQLGWRTALEPDDLETCAICRVEHPSISPSTCVFAVGSQVAPGGYAWVFPRGAGVANVGLGLNGSRTRAGLPKEMLLQYVEKTFPGAHISHLHAAGVPVGRWIRPLVRNGVMLVGDAAHQVNCMTGAGIAYSLLAGRWAGETAVAAFSAGGFNAPVLKRYEKMWARHYGKQQIRSHVLKSVLLNKFDDATYNSIAHSLTSSDRSKLTYLKVFLKAFARHPLLLIKVLQLFR